MATSRIHLGDLRASPALRLLAYYGTVAGIFGVLGWTNPWFYEMLLPSARPAAGSLTELAVGGAGISGDVSVGGTLASALVALLGALVVNIPAVWIYTVIMRQEGYEKAFVRMLTVLPIVVAGVVQVVRGDLAIAFALAGIVAAVRFRTTVRDLQNAVFAFAAIGVGLAAGTGSLILANVLSVMVSFMAYIMWRMNLGDVQPSLALAHSGIPLSEALVPGESHRAVVFGREEAVEPVHGDELAGLATSIDRLARYVRADALRKKKKYNTILLAYSTDAAAAREALEPILEEYTNRWVHVDTIGREGHDHVALEYLLRLKNSVDVGEMVERFEAHEGGALEAVEMKPIKGLRDRLT